MARSIFRADEFLGDALRLSIEDFARRHGRFFLIHLGSIGDDKFSVAMDETLMPEGSGTGIGPEVTLASYRVIPLYGPAKCNIGRSTDNDVVIDEMSLSKQHAVFEFGVGVRIIDSNSKNGTFVDERPAGRGIDVQSGQAIRLGTTPFTFLAAPELQDFIRRLKR